MSYTFLITETDGPIGVVTLNRPKANALSRELLEELGAAIAAFEADSAVRAVIITAPGDRFFSAGADIPSLQQSLINPLAAEGLLAQGLKTFAAIEACSKPVIAAVNGLAVGGGCELTLACHVRIASEKASFGQPEINLGVIPGWGGCHRLPRLIGYARAMDWLLTGRTVTAQEALEAGLALKVTPPEGLMPAAKELATALAVKPAPAVRAILEALHEIALNPGRGAEIEARCFQQAASSKDAAEGVAAFLEKRAPRFTGA